MRSAGSKKTTEQNPGISVISLPRPGWGLGADGESSMRTVGKALLVTLALVLVGLSAAPAQARFFVGFRFGYPGFYRPYPVFYRPYFVPPPPPPPVYIAPRPAVIVERRAVVVEPPPVVYRSVSYRYSRPVVWHHRHRVVHRRFCHCRLG
jgi:hypothetical protein